MPVVKTARIGFASLSFQAYRQKLIPALLDPVRGFLLSPPIEDNLTLFTNGYSTGKGYRSIVLRGPSKSAVSAGKGTLNKRGRVALSQSPEVKGGKRGFWLSAASRLMSGLTPSLQ
jgi:hypothetical protein